LERALVLVLVLVRCWSVVAFDLAERRVSVHELGLW
jgi:hypothetical protein